VLRSSARRQPGRAALAVCLALVGRVAPVHADAQGVYEPVEIRKNEQQLLKATGEYEEQFLRRGYRYTAPDLEALVEKVGARLALPPTDPYIRYRFHILRDPEPNAFALPDGQIYINTGLLVLLENEAQLAAVLAHEVHHTAGHHTLVQYRSIRGKAVAGMVLGPFTYGLSDIFLILSVLGYSRDLEEEADRKGARRMLEAGYDVREMPRIFEIMLEDPEGEQPHRATAWSDHPALQGRAEYTRAMAPELTAGADLVALRVEAQSFRKLVRRVALDTLQDLIAADYPRSAVALSSRLLGEDETGPAVHLALGDASRALGARSLLAEEADPSDKEKRKNLRTRARLTRGEREAQRLATPEGRENLRQNLEKGRLSYLRALDLDPSLAEAHRGLGYVLEGLGRPAEAGREFVIYLRARPEASDGAIIAAHLKEITERLRKGGTSSDETPKQ
jgi:predicted Zn-dependent protease